MSNKPKHCDLAPPGVDCAWGDGSQLMVCCVHRLSAAFRAALQTLPIIGEEFEDYRCPDFEPKEENDE